MREEVLVEQQKVIDTFEPLKGASGLVDYSDSLKRRLEGLASETASPP